MTRDRSSLHSRRFFSPPTPRGPPGLAFISQTLSYAANELRDRDGNAVPIDGLRMRATGSALGASYTLVRRRTPYLFCYRSAGGEHPRQHRVFGLGPEVDIVVPQWRSRVTLRAEGEIGVESRPRGTVIALGIAYSPR